MKERIDFNFEKLKVYQQALCFAERIYFVTKSFPNDELYGLTAQLRRCATSVFLNIAEGSARSKKDFSRFLDFSRGSVYECVAILQISLKLGYIKNSISQELRESCVELSKMLSGLKKSISSWFVVRGW